MMDIFESSCLWECGYEGPSGSQDVSGYGRDQLGQVGIPFRPAIGAGMCVCFTCEPGCERLPRNQAVSGCGRGSRALTLHTAKFTLDVLKTINFVSICLDNEELRYMVRYTGCVGEDVSG